MSVKTVLDLANKLEELVNRQAELQLILDSTNTKGTRLTGEMNSLNGQINAVKAQLKVEAGQL